LGWSLFRFFESGRLPTGSDFGIDGSEEIDRIRLAVDAYAAFYGDETAVRLDNNGMVLLTNGDTWKVISPLFKEDIEHKKIRVDTFEFFPDVIVSDYRNPNESPSIFDL
jgi:hypothetical protein